MKIIAVIDIGSNSIRAHVTKIMDNVSKTIGSYRETIRIGDSVFRNGIIDVKMEDQIIEELTKIRTLLAGFNVDKIRAVATAAFREAENAVEVVDRVLLKTGIHIEIISGEEEARLSYIGASANFELNDKHTIMLDIGGGSTELSLSEEGKLLSSASMPLGCLKLSEQFFKSYPPSEKKISELRKHIKKKLIDYINNSPMDILICMGGTPGNIAWIINKALSRPDTSIKYCERSELKNFIYDVSWKSIENICKIDGIDPKRADIILAAALIIEYVLDHYSLNGFYTLSGGLRTGLTIQTINKEGIPLSFQISNENMMTSRLIDIGKKFRFEEPHARKVNQLSMEMFNALSKKLKLNKQEEKLIMAASMLHDIGNYISFHSHHKHSYYLIKNSDFINTNHHEIELIANIARYHRKSTPKRKHDNLVTINDSEFKRIEILSGILRMADALDRSHMSFVNGLDIVINNNIIELTPRSHSDLNIERSVFDYKKKLFEKTTGYKVNLK